MNEILREPVTTANAWRAAAWTGTDSWIDRLTSDEVADLDRALGRLRARDLRWPAFDLDDFDIPVLGPRIEKARLEVRDGRGFALLRGIPVGRYTPLDIRNLYWGIGMHLGEVISQNAKGDLIGEVTDLGNDYSAPDVRGYTTRADLRPHNDSADLVCLLCVRKARSGGHTSISSSMAIFNAILRRHPNYLETLFEGFHYDLRGEGVTGRSDEVTQVRVPVYSYYKGQLSCRFNPKAIETAQKKTGRPLTPLQRDAVDCVERMAMDLEFRFPMLLEPGDIQILDNHSLLHSRTEYADHDAPEDKRLLLRLWTHLRDGRELAPDFANRYNTGARRGIAALKATANAQPA
jgi:hypothetical protein